MLFFCWFFLQKILCALEDPKIWFWFERKKINLSIFGCSLLSAIMRTKDQSLLCKKSCIFVWFSRCTCVHKTKMGTPVIVTYDDLCTNCSLNLLLFRCPKKVPKNERGYVVSSLVTRCILLIQLRSPQYPVPHMQLLFSSFFSLVFSCIYVILILTAMLLPQNVFEALMHFRKSVSSI